MVDITRQSSDVTPKPTKYKQINETPVVNFQFFKVRPGLEPQILGSKSDRVSSRPSGKQPGSCLGSLISNALRAPLLQFQISDSYFHFQSQV